ncbi:TPA: hypothetical protein ACH90W_004102 [Escherichia coli]
MKYPELSLGEAFKSRAVNSSAYIERLGKVAFLQQIAKRRYMLSTTDEKCLFRNLGGRKWMKLSDEQGAKLF